MAQITACLRSIEGRHFGFYCPGCRELHAVGQTWKFNGDLERPTIEPSLLVTNGHFLAEHVPGSACWCTYNAGSPRRAIFTCRRCHSFIRNGLIEFLSDCSHELAGKTVPIPPLPDWLQDDPSEAHLEKAPRNRSGKRRAPTRRVRQRPAVPQEPSGRRRGGR